VLVLVLTAIWGLRLGAHIYSRNRGQGEDKRYASLLRRNRGNLAAFVLRYVYWMQGRVMWFVSLPVQAAMYEHARVGPVSALREWTACLTITVRPVGSRATSSTGWWPS
jgi:steroid 5-alpha reductase family enzyme